MGTATVAQPIGAMGLSGVNSEVGDTQRLFAQQCEARVEEAKDSGQCTPFTVINFNPVPLGLSGVLKQYKVWTPDDGKLPADVLRISLPWEGKARRGHVLTIREPKKDGKMVGAQAGASPGEVTAQREPKLYMPKEIAYSFLEHYSPVFAAKPGTVLPPAPKDARRIYGVLVFEGDIHTLEAILDQDDPAKRIINVPVCHIQTIGKTSIKSFRTVPYSFDKYLEQMFTGQKKFADGAITRAQQKWNGTDQDRADISDVDRVWYRWAIDMGFAKQPAPGEKTWLNEYLTLIGDDGPKVDPNLRKCQACRAIEPEPNTPFCPKCAAPINTFTTFMAGFPVADAWLMALKGEEREVALAEMKLRKQGFGDDAPAPRPRGPYKSKGKNDIDPAAEIPAAESTMLPGEEFQNL